MHKEYLNIVTYDTPVLLWIKKTEQFDIQINTILCQHIRKLQTSKNSPVFLAHPVFIAVLRLAEPHNA